MQNLIAIGILTFIIALFGCATQGLVEPEVIKSEPTNIKMEKKKQLSEDIEKNRFEKAKQQNDYDAYHSFLKDFPKGNFASEARNAIANLNIKTAKALDSIVVWKSIMHKRPWHAPTQEIASKRIEEIEQRINNQKSGFEKEITNGDAIIIVKAIQGKIIKLPSKELPIKINDQNISEEKKRVMSVDVSIQVIKRGVCREINVKIEDSKGKTPDDDYMIYHVSNLDRKNNIHTFFIPFNDIDKELFFAVSTRCDTNVKAQMKEIDLIDLPLFGRIPFTVTILPKGNG